MSRIKNKIRKNAKLVAVRKIVNGKEVVQFYNPTKHLMQGRPYNEQQGQEALEVMLSRNKAYFEQNKVEVENIENA